MSKQSLISNRRKEEQLDRVVETIQLFRDTYKEELSGLKRDNPSDVAKATAVFQHHTRLLKGEISGYVALGYTEEQALERVLPKAYAVVSLASEFLWNKPHYPQQLKGGILLHEGYATEMATGEGKTLTATLPSYLNALTGRGVHVLTTNAYLAKRDFEEMSQLYNLLGLSCGLAKERGKISEEDIHKKTLEVLKDELERYTRGIEDPLQIEAKINEYIVKNKNKYNSARVLAKKALRADDLAQRKQAYRSDITYASASAIAFDYLNDVTTRDSNQVVQRIGSEEKANFVIIDEMDSVLIDDARTPFRLSDQSEMSDAELRDVRNRTKLAAGAMAKIEQLHQTYMKEGRGPIKFSPSTQEGYETLLKPKSQQGLEKDMTCAIILNEKTNEFQITTLGETILFEHYCQSKLNKILLANKDKIKQIEYEGNPLYREGYDYTMSGERLSMEPRALAQLIASGTIPELTDTFDEWGRTQYTKELAVIQNAVKAWFFLKEDVDYQLKTPSTVPPNTPDSKKNGKVIQLVTNGRTAEGRVYADGLQQALEAKEQTLKGVNSIIDTNVKSTSASIQTASFFARYKKFSGMTGTASESAFRNLYGLDTHRLRRQKGTKIVEHGERFYATTEAKLEAIYQEVLTSWKKGQPILISTTSIEESEKLHQFLMERFKKDGINKTDIPVLNANVSKLEEEAAIIAKAGQPKAITIATEMAGRGTDIKLGGEIPSREEIRRKLIDTLVDNNVKKVIGDKKITKLEEKRLRQECEQMLLQNEKQINELVEQTLARAASVRSSVEQAGGLKVICSGHFKLDRVDRQVKGRCGRQGDPGEVVLFNDPNDLLNIGVPLATVQNLVTQANNGPIIDNPQNGTTLIADIVYDAQSKTEFQIEENIRITQQVEKEVSIYRTRLREQQEQLKMDTTNKTYMEAVEFMIEETVKSIVIQTHAKEGNLKERTKLKKDTFDYQELQSLISEFMGIESIDFSRFKTVGELVDFLTNEGLEKYQQRLIGMSLEDQGKLCKQTVDTHLYKTWEYFEGYVETIKQQERLKSLSQVQGDSMIPAQLAIAYGHCAESSKAMIVRDMLNPDYQKKLGDREPREEIVPVRVTTDGVKKVAKDYDQMQVEDIQDMSAPERTSKFTNMQPHKKMIEILVGANQIHLNKEMAALGKRRDNEDELISVNFSDSPAKPKK